MSNGIIRILMSGNILLFKETRRRNAAYQSLRCPGFFPGWSGPGCWVWNSQPPACQSASPSSGGSISSSAQRSPWGYPAPSRTSSYCPRGQTPPEPSKQKNRLLFLTRQKGLQRFKQVPKTLQRRLGVARLTMELQVRGVCSLKTLWRPACSASRSFSSDIFTTKRTVVSVWYSLKSVMMAGTFSVPFIMGSSTFSL